jgi:hypothetical protein
MLEGDLQTLVDCYRLLEATGDLALCRRRYPAEVVDRLLELLSVGEELAELDPGPPSHEASHRARQALLDALGGHWAVDG